MSTFQGLETFLHQPVPGPEFSSPHPCVRRPSASATSQLHRLSPGTNEPRKRRNDLCCAHSAAQPTRSSHHRPHRRSVHQRGAGGCCPGHMWRSPNPSTLPACGPGNKPERSNAGGLSGQQTVCCDAISRAIEQRTTPRLGCTVTAASIQMRLRREYSSPENRPAYVGAPCAPQLPANRLDGELLATASEAHGKFYKGRPGA
jgi:hypothetical protein